MQTIETIPFCNLSVLHKPLSEELTAAYQRVLQNSHFILGAETSAFENEFAAYLGVKHCVSVNSGSDALYLALRALDIKTGDEVITVSHTFISTVDAILRNGATAVLADIDEKTYCIDPEQVKTLITPRTKAILPVHLYGQPAQIDCLKKLAEEYNLYLIEDACQAHGARFCGQKVGTFGHLGCFSFYPTKNLGALGDAGCVVTNDDCLAEKIRYLRNYGQTQKYIHSRQGINSRMDELQAAILRIKLPHLDEWNYQRQQIALRYNQRFDSAGIKGVFIDKQAEHIFHLYVLRLKNRTAVMNELKKKGIDTLTHYPIPVHQQQAYQKNVIFKNLQRTEKVCAEILSLPLFPGMTYQQVDTVIDEVIRCQQSVL